jgi:hypothetical protein
MEYFPGLKTKEESDHSVSLMSGHIEKCGWGFWAASLAPKDTSVMTLNLSDRQLSNMPEELLLQNGLEEIW